MEVKTRNVGGTVEILAANDFQAVPLAITESKSVKAGMPIKQDGKSAPDGTDAIGILLYDVDPTANPNAAVVVDGIIDWGKVKAYNTEVTADAQSIASALPRITFRDVADEGKTYAPNAG